MQAPEPTGDRYRICRAQYDRAVEAGVFAPDAGLEMIDGRPRSPVGSRVAVTR